MATEKKGTQEFINETYVPAPTPAQMRTDLGYGLKDHGCGEGYLDCRRFNALRLGEKCGAVLADGVCPNKKPGKI